MAFALENFREKDGLAWNIEFSITRAAAILLDGANVNTGNDPNGNSVSVVDAYYSGSDALDTSLFNGFPVNSIIRCSALSLIYMKIDATTWKDLTLQAL